MNRSESTNNGGQDEAPTETKSTFGVATGVALAAAAAIGIAGAVLGFGSSSSSSSETRKTMKAPGKNGEIMFRDDFEKDPQAYFSNSRKK
ncbi:hypothetical protein QN277_029013 [Acacia crassicarpa]|uniref:Uncharacterized protein n=1 Tax=Acacia crassicarpa TaxID=499986 RepID=A0AAE1J4L2_9FABA|nr:hypothetical protein QN277_029012 [Acacia crassicarpa]KAK4263625.1 hypothetical protein QN277_029013 [Acacia crassicarpa]